MAEVSIEGDRPVVEQDERTKVEADADSGDCEDYSSGSDRSLEDADAVQGEAAPVKSGNSSSSALAERRKRRHGSHGSRRHKGGSRHKNRGFHPYNLDPEEEMHLKRKSQELKEKENAAAVVRQEGESRFMNFPIAPFNSSQYLMDEHYSGSPAAMHRTTSSSKLTDDFSMLHSLTSTPAESQQDAIGYDRKDKEFTDIYATVHAESLQSLPKEELVKNYMSLEEKVVALQKKVAEAEQLKRQNDDTGEIQSRDGFTSHSDSGDHPLTDCSSQIPATGFSIAENSIGPASVDVDMATPPEMNRPTISVGDADSSSAAQVTGSSDPSTADVS